MSREPRRTPTEAEYSALRRTVDLAAEVCEPLSCFLPIRITDLSSTGCRAWAGFRLTLDRPVRLALPGLAPIRARTVRAEWGFAAFRFDAALHPSVLQHLVTTYPPRDRHGPVRIASAPSDA